MKPYLTKITHDFKSDGEETTTILSRSHNILLGDNGTGKTALLNAIEVAHTGRALDLGSRASARAKGLLAHLGTYVRTEWSDGSEYLWTAGERSGGDDVWFPMQDVDVWLAGSREPVLELLVRHFATKRDVKDTPVPEEIIKDAVVMGSLTEMVIHMGLQEEFKKVTLFKLAVAVKLEQKEITGKLRLLEGSGKEDEIGHLTGRLNLLKALRTAIYLWFEAVVKSIETKILDRVTALMPPGHEFGLLYQGLQYILPTLGVRKNGICKQNPWFSGYQRVLAKCAMAGALINQHPNRKAIIYNEDRWLGQRSYRAMLRALGKIDCVVLFQAPVRVRGRADPRFGIVEMEDPNDR